MKRVSKSIVTLVFALCLILSAALPAFAAGLGQVKSLKAKDVTYNSVTLTWSSVSGAKGYEVEQYSGKKWVSVNATVKATSLKVTGLKTGTTYKFRVRAYKTNFLGRKNDYGSYSSTVSVKPSVAKVTGLKVSSIDTSSAKLSWSKVSSASGYYVQQYKSKKWKTIKTLSKTSYTVTGLKLGSSYKFRVVAYKTVSGKKYAGDASSAVTVKPAVPAVSNIETKIDVKSVTFNWSKVSSASGYYVQQYKSKKWTNIKTIKSNKTVNYTVSKLTPNTEYKFRIVAYKGSYKSDAKTLTVTPQVLAPTNLKASSVKTNSLKLSWTASSNGNGYAVEQLIDGEWVELTETTKTSYTVSDLKAGTTYKFRISAFNGEYNSKFVEKEVTTLCEQVEGVKVKKIVTSTKASSQKVTLTWSETAAATGYTVYYAEADETSWDAYKSITGNSLTISNLSLNKDYKFSVAAYHSANGSKAYGAKSDSVTANLSKQGKTDLILMVVNAVNSSKKEQAKVTVDYTNHIYTKIDSVSLKWGIINREFTDIEALMKFLSSISGGEDIDTEDLSTEMSETTTSKKTFEYAQCWETNENGYSSLTTLNQHIAPSNSTAYLYEAEKIENIDKKVSGITYTLNDNGSYTIEFNILKETITNTSGGTPVHDGLTQGKTTIKADSETSMKMVMGNSTVKATINENGTLDYYYIKTPFVLNAGLTGEADGSGFSLGVNTSGSYTTTYNFSR